ncbi:MAG: hypothetical protein IKZ34_00675 [Alphaproteobacteria bacterium]|nr:hypothetical protein [Alphaproteobacteria bacterium]
MNKVYKEQDVKKNIEQGFKCLTDLARVRLKTRWKAMNLKERCDAARSLVFMEQVAKNPDAHFSRESTEKAWIERAKEYAQQKKLHDLSSAYYIVQDPTGIVWNKATGVFFDGNGAEYYRFCRAVQQWMYDGHSDTYATEIVENAKKYKSELAVESANCFARPFVEYARLFQK